MSTPPDPEVQAVAVGAFAALAHDTRLTVFRLLVQAGPNGSAGQGHFDRMQCGKTDQ